MYSQQRYVQLNIDYNKCRYYSVNLVLHHTRLVYFIDLK